MNESEENTLPAPLDLLYGQRGRLEQVRRRGLSVQRIVQAAIELADEDGLNAVSMSRVAKRLGFTPMSLYRHVRSKDELLALMVDTSVGSPVSLAEDGDASWRPALERWSWGVLGLIRIHPWLLDVELSSMPLGPNRLAWLDSALRALTDTPLTEDEKMAVVRLVNGFVFGEARFAVDVGDSAENEVLDAYLRLLPRVAEAAGLTALRRVLEAGGFYGSGTDPDTDFAFGLERVLDGIARLIEQRSA